MAMTADQLRGRLPRENCECCVHTMGDGQMAHRTASLARSNPETIVADTDILRSGIRGLISVLAIPAIANGRTVRQVAGALLDVMLRILKLEFAYVILKDPTSDKPLVLIRSRRSREAAVEFARRDKPVHANPVLSLAVPPLRGRLSSLDSEISIARVRLGLETDAGFLVAGARRPEFPTPLEKLLLGVGANHAALSLQEAQLLADRARAARELQRNIEGRTSELERANAELRHALSEIRELKNQLQLENVGLRKELAVARGGLAPWQLRRAKELMTANLATQVPLSWLAEECGLSVRHFARAFRRSTGVPPHRWFLAHRLEIAKEQLRDPLLSLAEIALACGFADQSHFTRMFTATVRMSPGAWRRMQMWQLAPGDVAPRSYTPGEVCR